MNIYSLLCFYLLGYIMYNDDFDTFNMFSLLKKHIFIFLQINDTLDILSFV